MQPKKNCDHDQKKTVENCHHSVGTHCSHCAMALIMTGTAKNDWPKIRNSASPLTRRVTAVCLRRLVHSSYEEKGHHTSAYITEGAARNSSILSFGNGGIPRMTQQLSHHLVVGPLGEERRCDFLGVSRRHLLSGKPHCVLPLPGSVSSEEFDFCCNCVESRRNVRMYIVTPTISAWRAPRGWFVEEKHKTLCRLG